MSLWFGEFQFEEEFNDEQNFATYIYGTKSGGNLATVSDIDWFSTVLPKNTDIRVTFEGSNYKPGIFNISWFTSGMKGLSNQNISVSSQNDKPIYTYTFNSGESGGTYFYRVMPFSSEFYKPDVYLISIETLDSKEVTTLNPIVTPTQNEISITEGNEGFQNVNITLSLDKAIQGDVFVHYTVKSGTANVGTLYDSDVAGTIQGNAHIPAGKTSVTISNTQIWSDTIIESDEYFWIEFDDIHVGALKLGAIKNGLVKVNIINDDTPTNLPNLITGTLENDLFESGSGDDVIDGFMGIDVVTLSGSRGEYTFKYSPDNFSFYDQLGRDGTDTLINIERVKFQDISLAFDLNKNAGTTAKILGAVFGKDSLMNKGYVGIGLELLDGGMSYNDLMKMAIDTRLGENATNEAVINLLYTNVVGVQPSENEMAYFLGLLDSGAYTVASLGVLAAETTHNADNINLVGLAFTGIEFF